MLTAFRQKWDHYFNETNKFITIKRSHLCKGVVQSDDCNINQTDFTISHKSLTELYLIVCSKEKIWGKFSKHRNSNMINSIKLHQKVLTFTLELDSC